MDHMCHTARSFGEVPLAKTAVGILSVVGGVSPPLHRELKAEDRRGRSDLIGQTEESLAKLLKPREEVKKAIAARIRAGKDLTAKAEIAESTGGYEDWLFIFAKWRDETAAELTTLYEERDIGRKFTAVTATGEYSSPRFTFPYRKSALERGLFWLDRLIDRLELAVGESPDAIGIESLHPEIYAKCRNLYEGGDYAEAVEKSFKLVRDKLRALTGYETGSEAFGKGLASRS